MTGIEILAVIVIALILSLVFYYGFRHTGPWGSFWTFLLVLFLGILLLDILITPIGPIWWGVAWIDLIIIGLLFALLLAAATPGPRRVPEREAVETSETAVAVGALFWLMVVFFLAAIVVGLTV